jgi:hypothetical protein
MDLSAPTTAFISGPIDASDAYFALHYAPAINRARENGHSFVIGPVPGIDTLALHFLLSPPPPMTPCPPERITVFMAQFEYADLARRQHYLSLGINVREVATAGAGTTTRMRDEEMTRCSEYDILRYRTEEEAKEEYGEGWWPRVSNTEVNERRRKGDGSLEYRAGGKGEGDGETSKGKEDGGTALGRRLRGYFVGRKG